MTAFRADLAALDGFVGRLAAFDRRAGAALADLDREVRRTHGQWSGAAAGAHLDAHVRWLDAATRLREAAGGLRTVVDTAAANYAAAVEANRAMWS